jgi:glycosyltransferase involved in cell wall biosynthesis
MLLMRLADRIFVYYPEELDQLPPGLRGRTLALDNAPDTAAMFRAEAGVDVAEVASLREKIGVGRFDPLLLSIGRLTEKARTEILLDALAHISGSNVKLVVIGEGPRREALQRQARELGLEHSVVWLGAMFDEQQIAPWMMAATAFVYAGEVGLSLIHAFAYGLPAIISQGGRHNPEGLLFEDGRYGATFVSGDAKSLSEVLLRELRHPDVMRERGRAAQEMVRSRLGVERMAERFLRAFDAQRE